MKTALIGGVLVILLVIVLSTVGFFGWLDFSNQSNSFERSIEAKYSNNQNVYDNGTKAVLEMVQIPEIYKNHIKEIMVAAIQGRYGKDGARQVFLAVQEANPNVDSSIYLKIQQKIEAFHDKFEINQTELIDTKRAYETYLTATTSGRVYNSFSHYPHIDLAKYDIVTSDATQDAFNTKRAQPLQLK